MKIAAIVVVYNPEKDLLRRNIGAFAKNVDKIIVWRNSEFDESWVGEWKDKILIWGSGENRLIADPVNRTMVWAAENGFDFLLTMDQDSQWICFDDFVEAVAGCQGEDVAIYAPNVNGYLKDKSIEYKDIEWVIQSGMLIDLKAVAGMGGFREDYGIYCIDEEFCFWLRLHGKKVRCFTNHNLIQKYGEARKSKWGFTVLNYSPFVRYRLIRNMIWMKREFPGSTVARRIFHVIFDNCRDIILEESNKKTKLKALARGVVHGAFGHIGSRRIKL